MCAQCHAEDAEVQRTHDIPLESPSFQRCRVDIGIGQQPHIGALADEAHLIEPAAGCLLAAAGKQFIALGDEVARRHRIDGLHQSRIDDPRDLSAR